MEKDIPAVYCQDLRKVFRTADSEVVALNNISIQVNCGELFMLVGPSGCGKTTLISVIAGILDNDSGQCKVFGKNINKLPERERTAYRGNNIGFVFQAYNLIPSITALENVAIPLLILGESMDRALKAADRTLAQVGLEDRANHYPSELSGGQQQRVAIARSIVHHPRLIVCDEPTAALDHHTGEKIMDIFKNIVKESNCTLIIVTHDSRIFSYADRIAELDDGRIVKINLK